jgi:hypothetical protein
MRLDQIPALSDEALQLFIERLDDRCSYHAIEFALGIVIFGSYLPSLYKPAKEEGIIGPPELLSMWLGKLQDFFMSKGEGDEEVELNFDQLPAQWQHFLVALSFYTSDESSELNISAIDEAVGVQGSMVGQACVILEGSLALMRERLEGKEDPECLKELQAFIRSVIEATREQQDFILEKNLLQQKLTTLQGLLDAHVAKQKSGRKRLTKTAACAQAVKGCLNQLCVVNSVVALSAMNEKVTDQILSAEDQLRKKGVLIVYPVGVGVSAASKSPETFLCVRRYNSTLQQDEEEAKERAKELAAQEQLADAQLTAQAIAAIKAEQNAVSQGLQKVNPRLKGVRRKKRNEKPAVDSDDEELLVMNPLESLGDVVAGAAGEFKPVEHLDLAVPSGSEDESDGVEKEVQEAGAGKRVVYELSSSKVTLGGSLQPINDRLLDDLGRAGRLSLAGVVVSISN